MKPATDGNEQRIGLRCPFCGSETRVPITRPLRDGTIRRVRECKSEACAKMFFTRERAENAT